MFGIGSQHDEDNQQYAAGTPAATPGDSPTGSSSMSPTNPPAIFHPPLESQATMPAPAFPVTPPTDPAAVQPAPADKSIDDVSLENAYIATDSPAANATTDSTVKPTASSLIKDDGQAGELLKLKQEALKNLAPLVDHLDQSPEEKFKTTMMLIQASDNVDLVPEAYQAANQIQDEKVKAKALLDVVNEINYFTQHHQEAA